MADATKPNLTATHDRLRELDRYLLEVAARAQAAGSPSVVMSVASLQEATKVLTLSIMDLETWTPPS